MPRKVHDVRTVVVKSVQEVAERRRWRVLDDNEVAILRSSQSLLDLSDLLIYAQPRPLLNDRAIWTGHRCLDRVGIRCEVQDSEWFRPRGPDFDIADLRERRARRRDSPRVGDVFPTTAGVVSSSSAVGGLLLRGLGCAQRGCLRRNALVGGCHVLPCLGGLCFRRRRLLLLTLRRGEGGSCR